CCSEPTPVETPVEGMSWLADYSTRGLARAPALWAAAALIVAAVAPAILIGAPAAAAPAHVEDPPHLDARAAVLIDAGSGRVLYAHNARTPMPMASTTKIMTGWLLAEMAAPETTIWVPFE